jgi:hypothetical protein
MTLYGFLNIVEPVGHNVIFLLVGGKVCDGIDSFMPHICLSLRITEDHRGWYHYYQRQSVLYNGYKNQS